MDPKHFKGDTGRLRQALHDAKLGHNSIIFNDNNKKGGRRLKVWFADHIVGASMKTHNKLRETITEQFGDRLIKCKVIRGALGYGIYKSFAVYLKN